MTESITTIEMIITEVGKEKQFFESLARLEDQVWINLAWTVDGTVITIKYL